MQRYVHTVEIRWGDIKMDDRFYCPNCGREIDKSWKVCPYCGYDFTSVVKEVSYEEREPQPPQPSPFTSPSTTPMIYAPPKKSHSGLIGAIVAIIIIIILIPLSLWYALPQAGVDVTTGAIRVIYHSVWHNNVDIYIDGEYKGEIPSDTYVTFHGIEPGTHTVRATTGGVYLDEKTVEVYAGETVTVELSYLG